MATTTSQGPMLYKDWLEQQRALNQQDYDKSVATAGEVLGENRAAVDYNYNRSTTGYGMLAEQLAQSGLSTSGYSDNLTRDAYANRQTGYSDAYKIYSDSVQKAADDKAAADRALDVDEYEHNQKMRENFLADLETVDYGMSRSTLRNLIAAGQYTMDMANDLFDKAGLTRLTEAEYNSIFGIEGGDNTPIQQTAVSPVFRSYYDILQTNAAEGDNKITPEFLQALFAAVEASGTAYDKQKLMEILEGPAMQGGMKIGNYNSLAEYLANTIGAGTVIGAFIDKTRNELTTAGKPQESTKPTLNPLPEDIVDATQSAIIDHLRSYATRDYGGEERNEEEAVRAKAAALYARLKNLYTDGIESNGTYYAVPESTATAIEALLNTEFADGKTYAQFLEENGYKVPFLDKEHNAELDAELEAGLKVTQPTEPVVDTPTAPVAFNLTSNGFTVSDEPNKLKEGKNFKISYNGKTYRAELDKQISLTEEKNKGIADSAKDAAANTLFYYDGGLYVKLSDGAGGTQIWSVKRRSMFYGESYRNLTAAIRKNIGDATTQIKYSFNVNDVTNSEGFTVKDSQNNTYSVKSTGTVNDTNVLEAAKSVDDNGIFAYGETLYIRVDSAGANGATVTNAYKLEPKIGLGEQYDALLKSVKESMTKSQLNAAQAGLSNASEGVKIIAEGDNVSGTWDIMFGVGGNNIKVKVGDKEYAVQTGEKADEVADAALGAGVPEKSVFTYNGQLYLRDKEKFYTLEERKNTGRGGYAKLYDAMFDTEGVQGDSYGNAFEVTKVRDGDSFLKFKRQDATADYGEDDLVNLKDNYGKTHRVKIEGEATGVVAPEGTKEDELFAVDGQYYVKHNGKIYKVKKRFAYGNAYDALLAKIEAMKDK